MLEDRSRSGSALTNHISSSQSLLVEGIRWVRRELGDKIALFMKLGRNYLAKTFHLDIPNGREVVSVGRLQGLSHLFDCFFIRLRQFLPVHVGHSPHPVRRYTIRNAVETRGVTEERNGHSEGETAAERTLSLL